VQVRTGLWCEQLQKAARKCPVSHSGMSSVSRQEPLIHSPLGEAPGKCGHGVTVAR
jgi:hypothetical protein